MSKQVNKLDDFKTKLNYARKVIVEYSIVILAVTFLIFVLTCGIYNGLASHFGWGVSYDDNFVVVFPSWVDNDGNEAELVSEKDTGDLYLRREVDGKYVYEEYTGLRF